MKTSPTAWVRDKFEKSGAFLFSQHVPDFCNDWGFMKTPIFTIGDIGQSFSSLSITINPLGSIILESQIKWHLYSTKTNIWRSPDNYVCNICDVRKTVKSPMAWDFPHIRKLAFTSCPLTIPWNLQCFHKKN